ncbi:hypothetical protein TorRG33x02_082470, partial [Trema orientale]
EPNHTWGVPQSLFDLIKCVKWAFTGQIDALSQLLGRGHLPPPLWTPLPPRWVKVSCDAAVREAFSVCAYVRRDSNSVILFASVIKVNTIEPCIVEALALKEGLL